MKKIYKTDSRVVDVLVHRVISKKDLGISDDLSITYSELAVEIWKKYKGKTESAF